MASLTVSFSVSLSVAASSISIDRAKLRFRWFCGTWLQQNMVLQHGPNTLTAHPSAPKNCILSGGYAMFCAFTDKCGFLLNLHDHYSVLSVLCCIGGSVIVSLFYSECIWRRWWNRYAISSIVHCVRNLSALRKFTLLYK